jgi:hypothetical protein
VKKIAGGRLFQNGTGSFDEGEKMSEKKKYDITACLLPVGHCRKTGQASRVSASTDLLKTP